MALKQWKITEPFLTTKCKLGEGICYNAEHNQLRFVDINDSKLYLVDLAEGPASLRAIDTKMPIGVLVDIEGADSSKVVLAGAKDGITKFNLSTGEHEYIARYWSGPDAGEKTIRMRSNDGAVDSHGRFWVEAFVDPEIEDPTNEGVVFRLDPDGSLKTMYTNIVIPNGITWNSADDQMHLSDTTIGKIHAFTYDANTGDISEQRTFYHHQGVGHPDGHTIDTEGNLWQALYGGSKVIRINKEGQVTGEIHLPTRNVTCCTFVGTELYITTAKESAPDQNVESAKFAGNVFKIDVGVEGTSKYKARL